MQQVIKQIQRRLTKARSYELKIWERKKQNLAKPHRTFTQNNQENQLMVLLHLLVLRNKPVFIDWSRWGPWVQLQAPWVLLTTISHFQP